MKIIRLLLTACLLTVLTNCGNSAPVEVTVETEEEKTLYALGLALAQNPLMPVKQALSPKELAIISRGFTDIATDQEMMVDLQAYGPKIQAVYAARQQQATEMGPVDPALPAAPKAAYSGEVTVETEEEKIIYALGMALTQNGIGPIKETLNPKELAVICRGFGDATIGRDALVNLEEYGPKINEIFMARVEIVKAKMQEKNKGLLEKAQKENPIFLEKAASEEGMVKTASGLLYKELVVGTGAKPQPTSKVKVHYEGTLTDGTVFDSSIQRGEPIDFTVGQVIPGWQEGLQMMQVGGRAKLVIPSDLAYGPDGRPPTIPPAAVLVFEVELLEVQ